MRPLFGWAGGRASTRATWCGPRASNALCLRTRRTNRKGFFDTPRYWRHFSAGVRASWDLYLQGYAVSSDQGSVCLRATALWARSLDAAPTCCCACLSLARSRSLHLSHTRPCTPGGQAHAHRGGISPPAAAIATGCPTEAKTRQDVARRVLTAAPNLLRLANAWHDIKISQPATVTSRVVNLVCANVCVCVCVCVRERERERESFNRKQSGGAAIHSPVLSLEGNGFRGVPQWASSSRYIRHRAGTVTFVDALDALALRT